LRSSQARSCEERVNRVGVYQPFFLNLKYSMGP
jgi:hypothetical protein